LKPLIQHQFLGKTALEGGKILQAGAEGSLVAGGLTGAQNKVLQVSGHQNPGEGISVEDAMKTGGMIGMSVQSAPLAVKALSATGSAMKRGVKNVASALTGVEKKTIDVYSQRADEVLALKKASGGDSAVAADQLRAQNTKDIQVARQTLNGQISDALSNPEYSEVRIDAKPIVNEIEKSLASVGNVKAKFRPDELNELKNVRDLVTQSLDKNGKIDLRTLSDIKEELQNIAKPSYNNGAQIFSRGDLAAQASKNAAAEARRLLNDAAPEIRDANAQLSTLHRIEERMNKNLIREGKPESALIAAGAGKNPRNAKTLAVLDRITGGNSLRQAENLAAGKTFWDPALLPEDFSGKAAARMLAGGGAGTVMAGPVGGLAGTALTSPATLKLGLDISRFSGRLSKAIGNKIPNMPVGLGQAAVRAGTASEVASDSRHAETAVERRLRELKGKRNSSASGQ
jgi:hypothetical protein